MKVYTWNDYIHIVDIQNNRHDLGIRDGLSLFPLNIKYAIRKDIPAWFIWPIGSLL